MAWEHLSINKPHLVYLILGGFTSLFMLCSSFIKERLYIGEATVATICGIIFGPHAANLIDPGTWGNTDHITLEFSRIVLVVQCFAVGVELPKYYMEKHWRSVVFLLIPVMTFGWLITSLFIWWLVLPLTWLEALVCAACVTATDPVLASSVVGKGKFAKRVPKHLRDVLSAESGCNDGMAFPFIYLALYLIQYRPDVGKVTFNWFVIGILYECVFGAVYGFIVGYIGRHGIKYAEKHELVDRESFLVFYFVLALFCAGSGSLLGMDDLLVGFAAGVGFSNDGWFTQKTEESHVSNVIDLLLNLTYFVYLGTIIPWEQYNNPAIGLTPWRLVVIALFVIFFRRIPIMLALKPVIPDIKTWREALFAGHFGPIGVGAIFIAILARAELETESTTPLASYTDPAAENYMVVALIWPITTFLVISSIIVHGSSIAVFTLGKHINTINLTMTYTTDGEGPGWLNRLPRIATTSKSQARSVVSENDADEERMRDLPPGLLPPIGMPKEFLRRQREEDNPGTSSRASSINNRRRKKKWDDGRGPGGPISQSAIYPARRRSHSEHKSDNDTLTPGDDSQSSEKNAGNEKDERDPGGVPRDPAEDERDLGEGLHVSEKGHTPPRRSKEEEPEQHKSKAERHPERREVFIEGNDVIVEDEDGEIVNTGITSNETGEKETAAQKASDQVIDNPEHSSSGLKGLKKKLGGWRNKDEPVDEEAAQKGTKAPPKKSGPALAYQFGNTIIVEDEDGEVVKTYEIPSNKPKSGEGGTVRKELKRMGTWTGMAGRQVEKKGESSHPEGSPSHPDAPGMLSRFGNWGFKGPNTGDDGDVKGKRVDDNGQDDDDRRVRFTIGGAGRRLTKEDFLKEIQGMDPKARAAVVDGSDAPAAMKALAHKDANTAIPGSSRLLGTQDAQMASGRSAAKSAGAEMARRRGAAVDEADEMRESGSGEEDERRPTTQRSQSLAAPRSGEKPEAVRRATNANSSINTGESEAERRRREQALKGVDQTPAQRGRSRELEDESEEEEDPSRGNREGETAAERRRREAALGVSQDEDSEDDDTPRVPPPPAAAAAARSKGIRFAQSPVRGEKKKGD